MHAADGDATHVRLLAAARSDGAFSVSAEVSARVLGPKGKKVIFLASGAPRTHAHGLDSPTNQAGRGIGGAARHECKTASPQREGIAGGYGRPQPSFLRTPSFAGPLHSNRDRARAAGGHRRCVWLRGGRVSLTLST